MSRFNIEPSGWNLWCSKCNALVGDTQDTERLAEQLAEECNGLCEECEEAST